MSGRSDGAGTTPRSSRHDAAAGPEGSGGGGEGAVARCVEAVLRRHDRGARSTPWGGDPGEPDRHAAVALVLRPGRGQSRVTRAADGRRGLRAGRGERPEVAAAPLFDRPLAPELRGAEALFIVRAEREGDPWSGQVGLPGGHAEAVDDGLLDAALRELREETGLALPSSAVLGALDEIRPRSQRLPSVAVTPFVAWHEGDDTVAAGPEVAGHFWTPLAALEAPGHRTLLTSRREGAYRIFPGVEHERGVIWGLTFAIVRRFLGLLPRVGQGPGQAGGGRDGGSADDRPPG